MTPVSTKGGRDWGRAFAIDLRHALTPRFQRFRDRLRDTTTDKEG